MKKNLPDIQNSDPSFYIPIQQVGVENVTVPFKLESREGGFHSMISNVSMRTNLDSKTKGISMSRLILTLKNYLDKPLKQSLLKEILYDINKNIGSTSSFIKFEFLMPMIRKSPISKNEFPLYYKCRFEGQLKIEEHKEKFNFFQGVKVQYASYCPCSAELCKDLKNNGKIGYPHAQRSYADVLIKTVHPAYVWLENVIELVENSIKTIPYPIIKRIDEQEIARIAGENPIFVEDAIRAISNSLDNHPRVFDWIVKCIHKESIHVSEAIAINWKGLSNGFNGNYFI